MLVVNHKTKYIAQSIRLLNLSLIRKDGGSEWLEIIWIACFYRIISRFRVLT